MFTWTMHGVCRFHALVWSVLLVASDVSRYLIVCCARAMRCDAIFQHFFRSIRNSCAQHRACLSGLNAATWFPIDWTRVCHFPNTPSSDTGGATYASNWASSDAFLRRDVYRCSYFHFRMYSLINPANTSNGSPAK